MQTPSLGRIVIAHGLDPKANNGATEAPAIIVRVWNEHAVNLKVLTDGENDVWMTSVSLYDADHEPAEGQTRYATWPART